MSKKTSKRRKIMALEFAINQLLIALILEFRRIGGGISTIIPRQGLDPTVTFRKSTFSKWANVTIKVIGWPEKAFIECAFRHENKSWWPTDGIASTPYVHKDSTLEYRFECTCDKKEGDVQVSIIGK